MQDLEDVTCCTISIDSRKQSTELIGQFLPSLQRLQFCQSFIVSFRDLGTSLRALKILDARECGIKHLDGISALVNLEELYLSYNEISEIDYRITHDQLRLLGMLNTYSLTLLFTRLVFVNCLQIWKEIKLQMKIRCNISVRSLLNLAVCHF